MGNKHAVLSASSSHRWLNCPPSALICAREQDEVSLYAKEGTDAHSLCEYKLNVRLGRSTQDPRENLDFYSEEMELMTDDYVSYVMDELSKVKEQCKDPLVMVEARLDFSNWVPDGFGTGDCIIVADGVLNIIDLKYGLGILVDAENNPQMMCYALGALNLFGMLYEIETIKMTIFQPRREHISTFEISADELMKWAEEELKPKAELAFKGEGEFQAGSHCQFCKIKASCRKRAEENLRLAKYEFREVATLEDDEIEEVLSQIDSLTSWANDVKDYAFALAMKGKKWNGYKLVESRSVRKYTNEEEVASIVKNEGLNPYEMKLLGITAMTKLLGKERFNELLGTLTHKPQGKPTLVPISDKRKEIEINEFKEEI